MLDERKITLNLTSLHISNTEDLPLSQLCFLWWKRNCNSPGISLCAHYGWHLMESAQYQVVAEIYKQNRVSWLGIDIRNFGWSWIKYSNKCIVMLSLLDGIIFHSSSLFYVSETNDDKLLQIQIPQSEYEWSDYLVQTKPCLFNKLHWPGLSDGWKTASWRCHKWTTSTW